MSPEGDFETNPHAFGEKWRVIDQFAMPFPYDDDKMSSMRLVDYCSLDRKKKSVSEVLCNKLKTGNFKGILLCYKII